MGQIKNIKLHIVTDIKVKEMELKLYTAVVLFALAGISIVSAGGKPPPPPPCSKYAICPKHRCCPGYKCMEGYCTDNRMQPGCNSRVCTTDQQCCTGMKCVKPNSNPLHPGLVNYIKHNWCRFTNDEVKTGRSKSQENIA